MLEGKEEYAIVDGNLDPTPPKPISAFEAASRELLAVFVSPGPQTVCCQVPPAARNSLPFSS